MAFLEKVFKREESIDIEEFLNNMDVEEEAMYEDVDAFVKPMNLGNSEDVTAVMNEASQGNLVLLNIEGLSKRNQLKLKEFVTLLKQQVGEIDGDIARISHDRVLITPSKVKIMKRKPQ